MNRVEHLLIKLMEECAEVQQRVSKALLFGLDEIEPLQTYNNNRERLADEITDLIAVLEMVEEEGIVFFRPANKRKVFEKKLKVEKYLQYSIELDTLRSLKNE